MEENEKRVLIIYIVGLRVQIVYWVLGLGREHSNSRSNEWCWMGQAYNLISEIRMGGQSEEKQFLGYARYSSNVCPDS